MTYIVWWDNSTDGWSKSDELPDLAAVLKEITSGYSSRYLVTKTVDVQLIETPKPVGAQIMPGTLGPGGTGMITPGMGGPYARGGAGMGPFDNPVSSDRVTSRA